MQKDFKKWGNQKIKLELQQKLPLFKENEIWKLVYKSSSKRNY